MESSYTDVSAERTHSRNDIQPGPAFVLLIRCPVLYSVGGRDWSRVALLSNSVLGLGPVLLRLPYVKNLKRDKVL